jgi:hypothetical protein
MQEKRKCVICGELYYRPNRRCEVCSTACSKERTRLKNKEWRKDNILYHQKLCRDYYHKNRDKRSDYNKKYTIENADRLRESRKAQRENNPERFREKYKRWYEKNKEKPLESRYKPKPRDKQKTRETNRIWQRERLRNDPEFKIKSILRTRIAVVLKSIKTNKTIKTEDLLGCSFAEFVEYIENLFTEGMTWGNHGRYGWHVDHLRPCASFDLTDINQQRQCFHYTNLQPLWATDNLKKGDSWGQNQ